VIDQAENRTYPRRRQRRGWAVWVMSRPQEAKWLSREGLVIPEEKNWDEDPRKHERLKTKKEIADGQWGSLQHEAKGEQKTRLYGGYLPREGTEFTRVHQPSSRAVRQKHHVLGAAGRRMSADENAKAAPQQPRREISNEYSSLEGRKQKRPPRAKPHIKRGRR